MKTGVRIMKSDTTLFENVNYRAWYPNLIRFNNHQSLGIPTYYVWKKLGVEKVHPHKFRRTMATRAIEKGMPIEQVQKILGHEQIDTTLRYAMVNQNNVKLSHRKYIS